MYTSSFRLTRPEDKWPIKKPVHTRNTHHKSRYGCQHCKLARLKCDEQKPSCSRCLLHRSQCCYGTNVRKSSTIPSDGCLSPKAFPQSTELVDIDAKLWHHFTTLTCSTLADSHVNHVINENIGLALHFPYLKHAALALAATHRRFLFADNKDEFLVERHLSQAITLFQSQLSSPSSQSTMDAVLLTSLMLSTQNFFLHPEESSRTWSARSTVDWRWLTLLSGWRTMLFQYREWLGSSFWAKTIPAKLPPKGLSVQSSMLVEGTTISSIPDDWRHIFGIASDEDEKQSPYSTALHILVGLRSTQGDFSRLLTRLMTFAYKLEPRFLILLQERDFLAVCIIAMWLGCLSEVDLWWVAGRARSECFAACEYLDTHAYNIGWLPLGHAAQACGYQWKGTQSILDPDKVSPLAAAVTWPNLEVRFNHLTNDELKTREESQCVQLQGRKILITPSDLWPRENPDTTR